MNHSPLPRILPAVAGRLLRTLAISACLALAVPAWAAVDEPVESSALEPSLPAGLLEARNLIREGRFDDALGVLRPLIRGRAAAPNTVFGARKQ